MPSTIDYNTLTPAQRRAVQAGRAPQMVVAGPGTGKTRVLVYRAAHVILDATTPIPPSEVVLITFTTKAAAQLKDRLEPLIGAAVQGVRAGTIHHFAYRLVKAHYEVLGLPKDFIVIDQAVMESFWQRWCERERKKDYRGVMTCVSRFKLGLESAPAWLVQGVKEYQATLRTRGALDYDDILTHARDLLRDHDDIRLEVQARIGALLVDEFQDTDPVQYALIKSAMDPERQGLFCVADDDQSIYAFRGARPQNVRKFIREFDCTRANGRLHILDRNFRSDECIFRGAEAVLEAADRIKRTGEVQVEGERGHEIEIAPQDTGRKEYDFILGQVTEWVRNHGVAPAEVAVFMPWNRQNLDLEEHLLRAGIPCEVSGIQRLMETPVVHRLVTLLQFLHKQLQGADVDLELNAFLEAALSADTYAKLVADAMRHHFPLYRLFHSIMRGEGVSPGWSPADRVQLESLYALIANLVAVGHQPGVTVGTLVEQTLEHLSAPLQLLAGQQDKLLDVTLVASFKPALSRLRAWVAYHRRASTVQAHLRSRLVIHHTNPFIAGVWHEMVRGMLLEAGVLQDYVLYGNRQEQPYHVVTHGYLALGKGKFLPPWTARDILITNDVRQGLAKAAALCGGQPSQEMTVVHVGTDNDPASTIETLQLKGQIGESFSVDHEGQYESPSVRLFKLMQGMLDRPPVPLFAEYVMVDLETTGTDVRHCRVVQIGALKVRQGAIVERFDERIALPPDLTADEAAVLQDVSGFDLADFEGAKDEHVVWQSFCKFVAGLPLVAYNGLYFDFRILHRLKKHYPDVRGGWTMMYDMLLDAHSLFPQQRSYSAENLRRVLLGDEQPTAHTALEDCEAQQELLEHFQRTRAQRQRVLGFEPFLTATALAMLRERDTQLLDPESEEAFLFKVGYMWALKGNHALLRMLRTVIPGRREVVEIMRHNQKLAHYVQEAPYELRNQAFLNLDARIEALIAPFASRLVVGDSGLQDLLSHIALWGAEASDHGQHLVTLSTYHSAKGLEFSHVICGFVCDGAFPDFRDKTEDDRRERRRLLYVGMTRAKHKLILTYPKQSNGFRQKPSPFLRDIPPQYVSSSAEPAPVLPIIKKPS